MRLPILRGALRGRWWCAASGGKLLRVLLGSYEIEQTTLLRRTLRPGQTLYDIGAHTGYYTLLASYGVGVEGRVVAFEPRPRNAEFLRAHLRLNGCGNVEVVEAAVSDVAGEAGFAPGRGSGTGRLAAGGALRVDTVRLDDFVERRSLPPAVVKIDVEGAESKVLAGATRTLRECRPLVFLSLHGTRQRELCAGILRQAGYRLRRIAGQSDGAGEEAFCVPGELAESSLFQNHRER